ncbi:MAG: hypothetical protein JO157_08560 [Acetobacteraceae bacterium]|nr:hypothetical protein [Acetobacteraceae bacterium]
MKPRLAAPAFVLRTADRLVPPLTMVLLAAVFLWARSRDPLVPAGPGRSGWETWYDQGKYLEAMRAWLAGDLRPLHHWYMSGYPLLGALFHALTPRDPFVIPDLICLLATALVLARLGARFAGPGGAALGALVFLVATATTRMVLQIWIVPWSSTPVAPLALALLLAAMRFADRPRALDAGLAGLAAGAIPWFRPADLIVAALPAGLLMAWGLARAWPGLRRAAGMVVAGLVGAGAPLLALLAVHVAIYGFVPGGYVDLEHRYGFEWGLVPLQWVTLVVDPEPLFSGQRSLIMAFRWMIPGFAGLLACVFAPGRAGRAAHLAVAGAVALQFLLFLAYRDLHLAGLFRYNNYHYFKWVLPLLALYAVLLVGALASRARWRGALAGCVCAAALLCWRPGLVDQRQVSVVQSAHRLTLPGGLPSLWDVLYVPATGVPGGGLTAWELIYAGSHHLEQGGTRFEMPYDFRLYPETGGFMLQPLRPFPPGNLTLETAPETILDASAPAVFARQHLAFGLPCWVLSRRAACRPILVLPAHTMPPGDMLHFDGAQEDPYLGNGWADDPDPAGGHWTIGKLTTLRLRMPGLKPGEGVTLDAEVGGYVPPHDSHPLNAGVVVNGHQVAAWHPESGMVRRLTAEVPGNLIGPGGELDLAFHVENARVPARYGDGTDTRPLGLYFRSLRVVPDTPSSARLP